MLGRREKLDVALGSDPRRTNWHRCGKRFSSSLIPFDYAFIGIPFLLFALQRYLTSNQTIELERLTFAGGTALSLASIATFVLYIFVISATVTTPAARRLTMMPSPADLIGVRINDKPGVGATRRDPVQIRERFMLGLGVRQAL